MNIGIITHNFAKSENDRKDAGVFAYDFAKDLSKKENVSIFDLSARKKLGKLHFWNPLDVFYIFIYFAKGINSTEKFIKNNNIDYVLSMWALPSGVLAFYCKKRFGTKYAIWCLGSDIYIYARYPIFRFIIKILLRNADCIFGNSLDICEKVEKLSGKKCIFLPAVTNLDKTKNPKKLITSNNILFVGRLETIKGPDILLEASKILHEKRLNFHIYFIGDGSMLPVLKDKTKKYNLGNNITFLGNVSKKDILSSYFSAADLLVIPSRSESMPLVFTEGIRNGLPVIAASVGDLPHFIEKYKAGKTFKSGDALQLYKILENAIKNMHNFKKTYKAGVLRLSNIYDSTNIVMGFTEAIYKKTTEKV
jgi:glycosyltransferase involved in cell wall biosynthesis